MMGNEQQAAAKSQCNKSEDDVGQEDNVNKEQIPVAEPPRDFNDLSDLSGSEFPYECLVFEGGGKKMIAYLGAIQVLDEIGVLRNIRRFAGTSGGAIAAFILALGYTPDECGQIVGEQINDAEDAKFGKLSLLPNILNGYGWHPGNKARKSFEKIVEAKLGSGDATLKDLYDKRGIELCVIATNVSTLSIEYLHPKISPDVKIADAVRMSISIPAWMQPFQYLKNTRQYYMVDGGLLCNFPIHCYDGWFLSMKKEDSFIQKLPTNEPYFGTYNHNTLGMFVFATDEVDIMKQTTFSKLLSQSDENKPHRPITPLAKERGAEMDAIEANFKRKNILLKAARTIMRSFKQNDSNKDGEIDMQELKKICDSDDIEVVEALSALFGDGVKVDGIMTKLDKNQDSKVTFSEFMKFVEETAGISFQQFLDAPNFFEINSFGDFAEGLLESVLIAGSMRYFKENDLKRSMGLHTDYIKGLEKNIQKEDQDFMVKNGRYSAVVFLRDVLKSRSSKNTQLND